MRTAVQRWVIGAMAAIVLGSASPSVAVEGESSSRVRGATPRLRALLSAATDSPTFRRLVTEITVTDGIVYIMEGGCPPAVRACLLHTVTPAGPNRILWIHVEPDHPETEVMASVGHELQHAIEILSNRSIRSGAAIRLFYLRMCGLCGTVYETAAAVVVGSAIREELEDARKDRDLASRLP